MPYQERDVSRDQASAQEMVAKSGQMGVPVILAEDPSRPDARDVIVGFDRPRLERLVSRVTATGSGGGRSGVPGDRRSGEAGAEADRPDAAGDSAGASGGAPRLGLRVKDDPSGILVDTVHPGSLADRAGVRPGDVVRAVDGRPVRSSRDLVAAAQRLASGGSVALSIGRDGRTMEVRLPA